MQKTSKIFVAGHKGLVGSAILRNLQNRGFTNIVTKTRAELDLINSMEVERFFQIQKPEYVFDAAAKVGGIHSNNTYSGDFIYENLQIQNNLIHFSAKHSVKRFLFLGSVCIYPKFASIPVHESSLLTGTLEPTNEAYAIAKIAGIKMCQAYYKQYGFSSVSIMPANLYGPNDNFDPLNGHVIPAMLVKFNAQPKKVTLWGDGTAYREFLYVDDMADACIFLMEHPHLGNAEIVNAGLGYDITIADLAQKISTLTNFQGEICWDTDKPNGTPRRVLDSTYIKSLGWQPKYTLDQGLAETHAWIKRKQ
jgi:GDP-L-fucose synthase